LAHLDQENLTERDVTLKVVARIVTKRRASPTPVQPEAEEVLPIRGRLLRRGFVALALMLAGVRSTRLLLLAAPTLLGARLLDGL